MQQDQMKKVAIVTDTTACITPEQVVRTGD